MQQSVNDFLVDWNLQFRCDRKWRRKYNIPFGSEAHLDANQIDIFLDIREDELYERLEQEYIELMKNEEEYKQTGKFLKERTLPKEKEEELLKKLSLSFKKM